MGYESPEQFKEVVVDRMRREVDPAKDWDRLIEVHTSPPVRSSDRRGRRFWPGGIPSKDDGET